MTERIYDYLFDEKLERQVLAGIFIDPDVADRLLPDLDRTDFHVERWGHLFEAMQRLYHNGEPVDWIGIIEELRSAGKLGVVGGEVTLAELSATDYGMAMSAPHHARRLRIYRRLRERERLAQFIMEQVYSGEEIEHIDASIEEYLTRHRPATKDDALLYGWDSILEHHRLLDVSLEERTGQLSWPWKSWNDRVRPLMAGHLGILAAPDGIGKTSYLDMIAEHWAMLGAKILFVHLEDDRLYKLNRRLSRYSRIPLADIEDGLQDEWQQCKRDEAEREMAHWADNLHYLHAPGWTMRQVCREIEALRKQGQCDAVVVDYLDKCRPDHRQVRLYGQNQWERQADDAETLKSTLEKSHIPGFTATQGNKAMQNGGTQTRQNIQGSGQKSQKSQLVLILTRDLLTSDLHDQHGNLVAKAGQYSPHAQIRIDKQNRGQTGSFQQYFRGDCFLVVDMQGGE